MSKRATDNWAEKMLAIPPSIGPSPDAKLIAWAILQLAKEVRSTTDTLEGIEASLDAICNNLPG
jgi:hypothetical protein